MRNAANKMTNPIDPYTENHFYRTQVNLGYDLWVRMSVSEGRCVDLTDVTLADEDTNSILTDNAKRAIQGNETMQVMKTNASGAIWWPNLQLIQVVPSGGQIFY